MKRIPISQVPVLIRRMGYPEPAMKTVYGWAHRGLLAVTRSGGRLYTTERDIKRFMER